MRAGRVGERAELGEIATAAERWAVAGQHHLGRSDGSRRATSSASSSAARASVENALCRCGRLNRTCRRCRRRARPAPDRGCPARGRPALGEPARELRPDCSVEYASDSVMTPARVGPAGSTERSTSSQTAAACGQRWHRSVSSASASETDATVTTRRSSQSSSLSVKVASSEGDPTRRPHRTAEFDCAVHEYFLISSCLYSLPVSVRGSCVSNEIDRGHL